MLFDEKSEKELEELLEAMESFPGESELEGALNGIFLLHETYDLNLTAFSLGQVEIPGQPGEILQSDHQVRFPKWWQDSKLQGSKLKLWETRI